MNNSNTFGFIGGGRVTYFLLNALQQKNMLPKKIIVADPSEEVRNKIERIAPKKITAVIENKNAAEMDVVFLAVHPPLIKEVVPEIKDKLKAETIFISLAPVVSIEKLSNLLGGFNRIIRMIPNAPSIIHQGYNPVAFGEGINNEEKLALFEVFKVWGEAPEVKERMLEAYAIITAMGPTYFWPQWVKLQQLGKTFGMSDNELKTAMPVMLKSAVDLLYGAELSTKEVMDLIPVYPLKDDEKTIQEIFEHKLNGLYKKLSEN